jgi:pyruvate/2-oxoglutarate dehydrogenase complex dihydrolipoamide dehydrogenase (E3) component
VQSIFKKESVWKIETQNENYIAEKLILATGSNPNIDALKPMVMPS